MDLRTAYAGKTVLVTGHTGFKGSWLSEWLLMLGARVVGIALPPNTQPALFDQLGLADRVGHHILDIRDRDAVAQRVLAVAPDYVFHLAAQPLVRLLNHEPVETYATNVMDASTCWRRCANWRQHTQASSAPAPPSSSLRTSATKIVNGFMAIEKTMPSAATIPTVPARRPPSWSSRPTGAPILIRNSMASCRASVLPRRAPAM